MMTTKIRISWFYQNKFNHYPNVDIEAYYLHWQYIFFFSVTLHLKLTLCCSDLICICITQNASFNNTTNLLRMWRWMRVIGIKGGNEHDHGWTKYLSEWEPEPIDGRTIFLSQTKLGLRWCFLNFGKNAFYIRLSEFF